MKFIVFHCRIPEKAAVLARRNRRYFEEAWNGRLAAEMNYTTEEIPFDLYNTRKKRYRAGRANRSNRPTKVSLHCTGFNLAFVLTNIAHSFYKMQKAM